MRPDLSAECTHRNKRRAIQHMDAKCPFTAPIQTQHPAPRGDTWQGGPHCRAVTPGGGSTPSRPSPLCRGTSASVAWIWATGEGGLWRGSGSRELPRRPSSLRMPHPLSLRGKTRWHRDSGRRYLHRTPSPLAVPLPEQSESPERIAEQAGSS